MSGAPTVYAREQMRSMSIFFNELSSRLRTFHNESKADKYNFTAEQIKPYIRSLRLADLQALLRSAKRTFNGFGKRIEAFQKTKETELGMNWVISFGLTAVYITIMVIYCKTVRPVARLYSLYSCAFYVAMFGLWYLAVSRLSLNRQITENRRSGLSEVPEISKINNYLSSVGAKYDDARDASKQDYDDNKKGTFYDNVQKNAAYIDPICTNLASYLSEYGNTYMDPMNPSPANLALDDLNQIQNFIDNTEMYMDRRYQSTKYKDATDKKVQVLYEYLASEALSPMPVDTTSTQLQIKKLKEALLVGLVTNNSMFKIKEDPAVYKTITEDLKGILFHGETMFQYSTDAIANKIKKIADKDTKNQRIIDNKRRFVANCRIMLAFIYKDLLLDMELQGKMPSHSAMYVNSDTFSRMMDDISIEELETKINEANAVLNNITRAVNRSDKASNERILSNDGSVRAAYDAFFITALSAGMYLCGYLYDLSRTKGDDDDEDIGDDEAEMQRATEKIVRDEKRKKKEEESRRAAEELAIADVMVKHYQESSANGPNMNRLLDLQRKGDEQEDQLAKAKKVVADTQEKYEAATKALAAVPTTDSVAKDIASTEVKRVLKELEYAQSKVREIEADIKKTKAAIEEQNKKLKAPAGDKENGKENGKEKGNEKDKQKDKDAVLKKFGEEFTDGNTKAEALVADVKKLLDQKPVIPDDVFKKVKSAYDNIKNRGTKENTKEAFKYLVISKVNTHADSNAGNFSGTDRKERAKPRDELKKKLNALVA